MASGVDTHTHRRANQNNFKKLGARGQRPHAPGLKIRCKSDMIVWCLIYLLHINKWGYGHFKLPGLDFLLRSFLILIPAFQRVQFHSLICYKRYSREWSVLLYIVGPHRFLRSLPKILYKGYYWIICITLKFHLFFYTQTYNNWLWVYIISIINSHISTENIQRLL